VRHHSHANSMLPPVSRAEGASTHVQPSSSQREGYHHCLYRGSCLSAPVLAGVLEPIVGAAQNTAGLAARPTARSVDRAKAQAPEQFRIAFALL
jgi:hypothetical protein